MRNNNLRSYIHNLLKEQPFCILCTQGEQQPYGSLIAFAFTDNLKKMYFSTPNTTRKYKLLMNCPQMALVVDSRTQYSSDLKRIEAVTITANASPVDSGPDFEEGIKLLHRRHPYLSDFLKLDSTALFCCEGLQYVYVTQFQNVSQWTP